MLWLAARLWLQERRYLLQPFRPVLLWPWLKPLLAEEEEHPSSLGERPSWPGALPCLLCLSQRHQLAGAEEEEHQLVEAEDHQLEGWGVLHLHNMSVMKSTRRRVKCPTLPRRNERMGCRNRRLGQKSRKGQNNGRRPHDESNGRWWCC